MKILNFKNKNGITLISLVITIIVMLILAAISITMLTGDNSILKRATDAKQNTEDATIRERIGLAQLAAMTNSDVKLDYEKLKIELAKEFGIEGTDWNISSKMSDPWIVTVGNVKYNIKKPIGQGITATDIASMTFETTEEKTAFYQELYGHVVTNYGKAIDTSLNDEWKIFYIGTMGDETESHIYLIADSYVKYDSLPTKTVGEKPNTTTYAFKKSTDWKSYFATYQENSENINDGILPGYSTGVMIGSSYATVNNIKNLNYSYYNLGYAGESQPNMRAVASMLDTNIWSSFMDSNGKAKYAIGGPTLEMLMKSYNDSHGTDYGAKAISETGYQITKTATSDEGWKNTIDGLNTSDTNKLYISESINTNAESYFIASPSARGITRIPFVQYAGTVGNTTYNYQFYGFRPLICLNSNVELEKQENGTYIIK